MWRQSKQVYDCWKKFSEEKIIKFDVKKYENLIGISYQLMKPTKFYYLLVLSVKKKKIISYRNPVVETRYYARSRCN